MGIYNSDSVINLEIDNKRLEKLSARIKPVIEKEDHLYYIEDVDLRSVSFIWSPQTTKQALGLIEIGTIATYHTYGYAGFFKPSIAEVIAQIPSKYIEECVAFKINENVSGIVGKYQQTTTILYKREK